MKSPGHGSGVVVEAGKTIEHGQGRRRSQQLLVGVLTGEVHQGFSDGFELSNRAQGSVHLLLVASFAGEHAAQEQGAIFEQGQILSAQQVVDLASVFPAEMKLSLDDSFGGSGAHHVGRGPLPHQQQQSLDENGFSRAGLAGQHRESGLQREFDMVDEGDILHGDVRQHGGRIPLPVHPFKCWIRCGRSVRSPRRAAWGRPRYFHEAAQKTFT